MVSRFNNLTLFSAIMAVTLLYPALALSEPKTAVADNGREVLLKDNGEWEYVSDDIFATTQDGQRIRLQPNQKWQKVSDAQAPVYQPVAITTVKKDSAVIKDGTITLDQVHIENQRETIGKNKRVRSNLVFYLELESDVIPDISDINVRDSRNKTYPVFSASKGILPGSSQTRVVIRAKGAPRWWGVKFFSLDLRAGAVGNTAPIELRKPMQDVLRKEVSELPEDNL